jgi:hypothetical protein
MPANTVEIYAYKQKHQGHMQYRFFLRRRNPPFASSGSNGSEDFPTLDDMLLALREELKSIPEMKLKYIEILEEPPSEGILPSTWADHNQGVGIRLSLDPMEIMRIRLFLTEIFL